jgi:hypothetical protein
MNYLCCVCDNRAAKGSQFCKDCVLIYTEVENEEWFKDLCRLMKKQRMIDQMERYTLYKSNSIPNIVPKIVRPTGRPRTSIVIRELVKILKDSDSTLSVREIEEICRVSKINVSRETIRRILQKLKKEEINENI